MIKSQNLTVSVKGKKLIDEIDFSPKRRKITVILGRNGSGKTTLLRTLSGNTKKYFGKIFLDGEDIEKLPEKDRAKKLSYMPQVLPAPMITTRELVSFGRYSYLSANGVLSQKDWDVVEKSIQLTNLCHKSDVAVCHLSGGERQLAYFAMLLAQGRDVLLMDEPVSGLDTAVRRQLYSVIEKMRDDGRTIVLTIHDINDALAIADDIFVMNDGKFIFHGDREQFINSDIAEKIFDLTKFVTRENKIFFHFEQDK